MYKIVYEDEHGPHIERIEDKNLHSRLKELINLGCYICHVEPA